VPTPKSPRIRIAALLTERSSLALAFLMRDVFARANRILAGDTYDVRFISAPRARALSIQGFAVPVSARHGRFDYLIVTPLDRVAPDYAPEPAEVALVRRQHDNGAVVASACLGAFALASAGLLDGREATTHWAWQSVVKNRYPQVNWVLGRMICDLDDVITAGGYLAVVDLALHIVAATSSRATAHRLGQSLLADSIRQKQSIYAQPLIDPQVRYAQLNDLARWLERHLDRPLPAAEMARRCRMSLRTFHRRFLEAYGVTPRRFVQIKRIEKSQELLRTTARSTEQILQSVGVSDTTSFRRVFQRELGCSPAEYRRRLRA
jgi:transcriptional regulator GlxA family with amidase domain